MSLPSPDYQRLGESGYEVARPRGPIDLWLHGNEGPAPSDAVCAELARLDPETLRRYPDPRPLEVELARRHGVDADRVLVTAGADEAIDRFCRAFLAPGRNVVVLSPAFEMVERYVQLAGAELREVPWWSEAFPTDEVIAAIDQDSCAVVLASPSNPTGLSVPVEVLAELSRRAPDVWLFVDLVYAAFLDHDPTAACLALPNALVVGSFSKSGGLAGLRVGYALGPQAVVAALRRAGGPYSVAGPSLALARRALDDGADRFGAYRDRIAEERAELARSLAGCGVTTLPSGANFVLARTERAQWLWEGLAGLGIAVRWFRGRPGLQDAVRITCPGDPAVFARLLAAVHATLQPECLLFDMDGVLVDVRESYDRGIIETAAAFGVQVGRADIAAAKADGNANNDWILTQRLLSAAGREVALEEVTERFEAAYQERLWKAETLTVAPDWLAGLASRWPLGIVTGRPRRDAERLLATQGIAGCFQAVVCMEDATRKPSPEPVTRALAELGCRRGWLLGDTVDDVHAARAAGVVPIGVLTPGGVAEQEHHTLSTAGAARVLARTDQLESLLPEPASA